MVDHLNAYVSTPGLFKNSLCLTSSKWVLSTFFRASEGEGSVEKVWRPTSVTPLPPQLHRCHISYTAAKAGWLSNSHSPTYGHWLRDIHNEYAGTRFQWWLTNDDHFFRWLYGSVQANSWPGGEGDDYSVCLDYTPGCPTHLRSHLYHHNQGGGNESWEGYCLTTYKLQIPASINPKRLS